MFGITTAYEMLGFLGIEIEKQLECTIDKYVMILSKSNKVIQFKINDEEGRRPLDEPMIYDALKIYVDDMIDKEGLKNITIEYAFFFYYRNDELKKSGVDIHITTENNEKINITKKINQ